LDARPNAVKIFQDVVVPEADNSKSLAFEISTPAGVALRRVLPAVDFSDQAQRRAEEVHDVAIDFHLAAKLQPFVFARTKYRPEFLFCIGRVGAQRARSARQKVPSCHNSPSPRRRRADPPPRRGEGFAGTANA